MTWIWQREAATGDLAPTLWRIVGRSCNVPVTVRPAQPVLTLAMVQRAFRDVDFARPGVRIQPEGTVTLVNLPTFYRVVWPASGVAPNERATVRILGRSVTITPSVSTYAYDYGEGGPATVSADPGGVYPSGVITHSYSRTGLVPARVRASYTAVFSVDGGPAQPVADTVVIQGPATMLVVREARARLEAAGG
jgi:hypothetical protein